MGDRDDDQLILALAIYHLIGIATHKIETVQVVAMRESLGVCSDLFQCPLELGVKSFGSPLAALGVPRERFSEVVFGGRRNEYVSHRVLLSGALAMFPASYSADRRWASAIHSSLGAGHWLGSIDSESASISRAPVPWPLPAPYYVSCSASRLAAIAPVQFLQSRWQTASRRAERASGHKA